MLPFCTLWKHQKTRSFLGFPGGVQWEYWLEMGKHVISYWLYWLCKQLLSKNSFVWYKALVPVTKEIQIPYANHRYIIGQKGQGIRKMMEEFDVNIGVPPADQNDDMIKVTGPIEQVENAIAALEKRNEEIEEENENRRLRNFELVVHVPNKYHSKLIGIPI